MNITTIKAVAAALMLVGAASAVRADQSKPLPIGAVKLLPSGKGMFTVATGEFNAFRQRDLGGNGASALANLEYRFGTKIYYVGFAAGGLANSDGGRFLYVGNYADIKYKSYIATPVLSVGAYHEGAGPDLGGTLQFRSSLTLAYQIEDGSRVGIRVAHISNGGIHDENPGANEVLLTYSFSFR